MKLRDTQAMQTWVWAFVPGIFTSVMGTAGLGIAWRVAHLTIGLPGLIGEVIIGISFVLAFILVALYSKTPLK